MDPKLEKNRYTTTINCNQPGKRHIAQTVVYGDDFIHLKAFKDFCRRQNTLPTYHDGWVPHRTKVEGAHTISMDEYFKNSASASVGSVVVTDEHIRTTYEDRDFITVVLSVFDFTYLVRRNDLNRVLWVMGDDGEPKTPSVFRLSETVVSRIFM